MKRARKEVYYLTLTSQEALQLLHYVRRAEHEGIYYGDRRWFDKRHNILKTTLENIEKTINLKIKLKSNG